MTTIEIRAGSYHAAVLLDMLPSLPVRNIRKLLKIMYSNPYENTEAIQTVTDWLPETVKLKKAEWYANRQFYFNGWQKVKKGSRKKADIEQRAKNRVLTDGVKYSKADYDQIVKFQSIFLEVSS